MNKKMLTLIKRVAALLLLVCFVLPLSRCTSKTEMEGQTKVRESYTYGYQMAGEAWAAKNYKGLFVIFVVFMLPAVSLGFKARPQSVILFFSSFVAAYALYGWVFVFASRAEIGGIIAITCWVTLFGLSCLTLCELCRRGSLFTPAPGR